LARIQRLRASAVEAVFHEDEPWVAIAANQGYADQAHLIREFRDLLGLTPKDFEQHFRRIEHGRMVR
jgi:AraC-like DNA-binding protein